MSDGLSNPVADKAFREFSTLCRRAFGSAMDEVREEGQKQNLSAQAICVAIAVAAIHAQALAIVGGKMKPEDFDGLLADDVQRIRDGMAARGKQQ